MPGLQDLASLLGVPESQHQEPKPEKRRGHDGQVLNLRVRVEKRRGKPVTIAWGFFSHPMQENAWSGWTVGRSNDRDARRSCRTHEEAPAR